KSILSILTAQWLARLGKRTVLVDLDLSGANIHTLLGISDPPLSLNDLLARKVSSLTETALQTSVRDLSVICGASENLAVANLVVAKKIKLMRHLSQLEADFVLLDLGAGTSFNMLDFFLFADSQVLVTTAEPISIFNAYGFLRNSVYRRLTQMTRKITVLQELVRQAADPQNQLELKTVKDLFQTIVELGGKQLVGPIENELQKIRPRIVVNQVRSERDLNASQVIRSVSEKYLGMHLDESYGVPYDRHVKQMVAQMQPLTSIREGGAIEATYELAADLVSGGESDESDALFDGGRETYQVSATC
ncbi:MAG: hypothetical protein JSU96_05865, partial [Acidobacteriota bacterium]